MKTKSTVARRRVKRRQDRVSHKKLRTLRSRKYARKTARTVMRVMRGGGGNEKVDLNRNVIEETVTVNNDGEVNSKESTLDNVFGTKLFQKTTLGFTRRSYVLKISIDIGKYKHYDTEDKYADVTHYSDGISSSGETPPHMKELINGLLSEVFQPPQELQIAEELPEILTYNRAYKTRERMMNETFGSSHRSKNERPFFSRGYCTPFEHLFNGNGIGTEPQKYCNIEVHFEPLNPFGFQITYIKYTVIRRERIGCMTGGREKDDGMFPVYRVEEKKNLKMIVHTNLKEDELKQKLTMTKSDPFYVISVIKSGSNNYVDYYGFDKKKLDEKMGQETTRIIKEIKDKKDKIEQEEAAEKERRDKLTPEQLAAEDEANAKAQREDAYNEYLNWR